MPYPGRTQASCLLTSPPPPATQVKAQRNTIEALIAALDKQSAEQREMMRQWQRMQEHPMHPDNYPPPSPLRKTQFSAEVDIGDGEYGRK